MYNNMHLGKIFLCAVLPYIHAWSVYTYTCQTDCKVHYDVTSTFMIMLGYVFVHVYYDT